MESNQWQSVITFLREQSQLAPGTARRCANIFINENKAWPILSGYKLDDMVSEYNNLNRLSMEFILVVALAAGLQAPTALDEIRQSDRMTRIMVQLDIEPEKHPQAQLLASYFFQLSGMAGESRLYAGRADTQLASQHPESGLLHNEALVTVWACLQLLCVDPKHKDLTTSSLFCHVENLAQPMREYYEQNYGEWEFFAEKRNHLLYLSRLICQPAVEGVTKSPPGEVDQFLGCQYWGANVMFSGAGKEKPWALYIKYITNVQRLPAHHRMQLIRSESECIKRLYGCCNIYLPIFKNDYRHIQSLCRQTLHFLCVMGKTTQQGMDKQQMGHVMKEFKSMEAMLRRANIIE